MPMIVGQQGTGRELKVRLLVAGAVATLALLTLVGRLYHLQIRKGEEYHQKSIGNFVKETRVLADRGLIFDSRGTILVDSRPSYNVTLTPAFCQPPGAPKDYCLNEVLPRLATYLSLTAEEVQRTVESFRKARGLVRFRDFPVKVDVDLDALDRLEANKLDLAGVDVVVAPHRNYRYGPLAAHTLGYMNEITAEELAQFERKGSSDYQLGDYIGRRGVERRFERTLRGKDGARKDVVDAKGRRIPRSEHLLKDIDRLRPPRPGNNLVLSIDLRLQQAAEALFAGDAGVLAAVDVNTGFVLALVSRPAYDPNQLTGRITRAQLKALSEDPLEPLIFRAVQEHYHPGSTFKVVTALAALEQGVATSGTRIFCGGGYNLGRRRWRCHKDSGHGNADLHHALSWSCDTYFYAMADRMGMDPIADMARRLGFGRVSGLELSPEVPGVVPSVAYHNRVTPGGYTKGLALNTAIGQGDANVTPMQLLMAYAALANGGTLYRPQVVRRIEDAEGRVLEAMQPEVVGKLDVEPAHLAAVRKGLEAVVNEPGGTAYSKRLKDVRAAGKTGTAQVVALGGGVRLKKEQMSFFQRDHAWFAAYAPADQPEIAVVSLNEHGGHGGSDAAPMAMGLIAEYFRLKAEDAAARSLVPNGAPPPEMPPLPAGDAPALPPAPGLQKPRPAPEAMGAAPPPAEEKEPTSRQGSAPSALMAYIASRNYQENRHPPPRPAPRDQDPED